MKWLVFGAFILVVQQPAKRPERKGTAKPSGALHQTQAKQPNDSQKATDNTLSPSHPAHEMPAKTTASEAAKTQENQQNFKIQRKLVWFTGLLVFVGAIQAGIFIWQAIVFRRTLRAINRQTINLRRSVVMSRRSANAAKLSAEATKRNVDAFMAKERGWLKIELKKFKPDMSEDWPIQEVKYRISHFGPTIVSTIDASAMAYISDSPEPVRPSTVVPMGLPPIIKPDFTQNGSTLLFPKASLNYAEIGQILKGDSFVHFVGWIQYRDVFGEPHVTRFRYVWRYFADKDVEGNPWGYWAKSGDEHDNAET